MGERLSVRIGETERLCAVGASALTVASCGIRWVQEVMVE